MGIHEQQSSRGLEEGDQPPDRELLTACKRFPHAFLPSWDFAREVPRPERRRLACALEQRPVFLCLQSHLFCMLLSATIMLALFGFDCCTRRRDRIAPAAAAAEPAAAAAAGTAPELAGTPRAGDARILKPKGGEMGAAQLSKAPSRSLLEASQKRLAQSTAAAAAAAQAEAAAAGAGSSEVPLAFLKLYMAAIKDGNIKWVSVPARLSSSSFSLPPVFRAPKLQPGQSAAPALCHRCRRTLRPVTQRRWTSDPAVSDLFADNAKMLTQDKQTFHGKEAVLKRLDKGERTGWGGRAGPSGGSWRLRVRQ